MKNNKKQRIIWVILVLVVAALLAVAYFLYPKYIKTAADTVVPSQGNNQISMPTGQKPQSSQVEAPAQVETPAMAVPEATEQQQIIETHLDEVMPAEVIPEGQALELPEIAPNFRTMTAEQKQDIIEQARRDAIASALAAGQSQQQADSFGEMAVKIATKAIERPVQIEVDQ